MGDESRANTAGETPAYPLAFDVDYPDRELRRLSTAFRLILIIPVLVVLATVNGEVQQFTTRDMTVTFTTAGGLLFLPLLLMLLFRRKYPRWWYEWNRELLRFINRVSVYLALMDDRYPSTDAPQSVRLDFDYPDAHALNRWLPLVKWLLAIPHYIVLLFLDIAAVVVVIIAWFAILITGRYPRALFDFLVGVGRWHNRVIAYAFILVTDEYPPFRLHS